MVTCIVTWFHRMSLPSTTGPFQTLKTLGITCASNNVKKSKTIVSHCLTKSFGTIWNFQLKKITSTQLAKMLLKCAWWITEKRRSDKWLFPWNMRRNSRRELRRRSEMQRSKIWKHQNNFCRKKSMKFSIPSSNNLKNSSSRLLMSLKKQSAQLTKTW